MIKTAGSGHYASSMSALQIMYRLFYEDRITPEQFILSKGHAAPALYAILFDLGYLAEQDIMNFRKYDGIPGHPSTSTNGILASSGSLGMGISKAIGLAYAKPYQTFHVLIGDGELQEGQNWEALLYMYNHNVENIRVYVDCNRMQYSGECLYNPFMGIRNVQFIYTDWQQDNSHLCAPKIYDMTYSKALGESMRVNPDIICLCADLEHDFGLTPIKVQYPDRFIQTGICEQHMVSMANGLALAGRVPICHTFSAFYKRAVDQMYNCYHDGIKIGYVAGLCGIPQANIGISHLATDPGMFSNMGIYIADNAAEFFELLSSTKGGIYLEAL